MWPPQLVHWETMRRWKVWLARNAHNCCPEGTKHNWVIVSPWVMASGGGLASYGRRVALFAHRQHRLLLLCVDQSHHGCSTSSVAVAGINFSSEESFVFLVLLQSGLLTLSKWAFVSHLQTLLHKNENKECAGNAAKLTPAQLIISLQQLCPRYSFHKWITTFAKPKHSLLKPTRSLLPQSEAEFGLVCSFTARLVCLH